MRYLWLTLVWIAAICGMLALALRGGDRYSVHDAEAHAVTYGDSAREAHGPITAFLWVVYASVALFTIGYSVAHWADIAELLAMMGL
jgi:hypothetical protein